MAIIKEIFIDMYANTTEINSSSGSNEFLRDVSFIYFSVSVME